MHRHWVEELADRLEEHVRRDQNREIVINGGLSVSGLQHIGRLRGEVLIGEGVRRILEERGYNVRQMIVLYTQDAWKGKEPQRRQFPGEEGKRYVGWPLIRVPDPHGCHSNWVEHYWEDFGGYLDKFTDGRIQVVDTTSLYKGQLKPIVVESIEKREKVRSIINKYRGRNPYPEDWVPFEPVCSNCGRIDRTKTLRVENGRAHYKCRACGYEGEADLSEGKLNWRLEWAGVWKALRITFEPYGKDHAAPGGSRDSCVELSKLIFEYEPPLGTWYEWVSLREGGRETDMSSSDFKGVTPREWYEVAHPEVLRYIYYYTPPRRKIVIDMGQIPSYYQDYYQAEDLYYQVKMGEKSWSKLGEEEYIRARSYQLAQLREPPEQRPFQPPYTTLALISQALPPQASVEHVARRLRSSGLLDREPAPQDLERLSETLERARRWVEKYAPPNMRYTPLKQLGDDVRRSIKYTELLRQLGTRLADLEEWSQERIKEAMIQTTSNLNPRERREFYQDFYRVLVGRPQGPRAAPLVEALGREFVVKRLTRDL